MALEGLRVILDKAPVVPTPPADQLVTAPDTVDTAFLHHVRTYVPFGHAAGGAEGDAISIVDYEKRLIAKVIANGAPKGYITADFGYGKTSTALYTWDRCRRAGLLAVPPFQLGKLDDLIRAAYGWSRYELKRTAPGFVPELEALYARYSERSVETDADGSATTAAILRKLVASGRLNLNLVATDYATFFEGLADLAQRAGFTGVVVIADELQQYLDPAIRSGHGDPIAPLFNIVEAFNTRRGRLPVGLVFSLLRKDFGVINDQRGDFIQRLKMDGLGLDLGNLYDKRFAARLWRRLAEEFDFTAEAPEIVSPTALDALGQIAARDDLANGPRTVIAAFSWMTRRFLEAPGAPAPVTPLDLVDAFLTGEIVFDGTSRLQTVVQTHLETPLVAARADLRRVVKVLAAFPTDGATDSALRDLGLWDAASELDRLARGEISIMVGGGLDDRGDRVPYGYTLRGLEPQSAVAQDWLSQTLREFSRNFVDTSETTIGRAEAGFSRLLTDVVFRAPYWKRVAETERRRTDGANRSLLFEGSFQGTTKQYPERRVLVRILREGERPAPLRADVDLTLDCTLAIRLDADDQRRRAAAGTLQQDADGHARLTLNLFHRESEDYYPDLQAALQPVMMPNQVTPLLMLALHEYLEEKRRAHAVPKDLDAEVSQHYQPRLLEHSAEELFNADLGASFNARGPRVVEELFRALIAARYPAYRTLIRQANWRQALADYLLALERLENRHERQGTVDYEATKEDLARLFNRANPAMDSFIDSFPELIVIDPKFRGRERSKVRFRLHPFEEHLQQLLRTGKTVEVVVGKRKVPVREISLDEAKRSGVAQGYRPLEIGMLLDLMAKRELVELLPQRGLIQETAHIQLDAKDLARQASAARERVAALLTAFPDDTALSSQDDGLKQLQRALGGNKQLDEVELEKHDRILRHFAKQLDQFLESKRTALRASAQDVAADGGNSRTTDQFGETIAGALFAQQLDPIRHKMIDASEQLRQQCADIKQRAFAAIGQLNTEHLTDDVVIRGQQDVAILRRDAQRIATDSRRLDERAARLATARRVLVQATDFDAKLALEGSAITDPDLASSFRALMGRIQAELSSRKETALEAADGWETNLGEIRNRLTAQLNAARNAFDQRKAHYSHLLRQYAHVPADRDPLPVVFNVADPSGAADALANAVSTLLDDRLKRIAAHASQSKEALRALIASGEIAFLDAPEAHGVRVRNLVADLDDTSARVASLARQVIDRATIDDLDTGFPSLLKEFAALSTQAGAQFQMAERSLAAVQLRQLDEAEHALFDQILRLSPGGGALDVGLLVQDEAMSTENGRRDVWRLLERLYRKRRLTVHIAINRPAER